jgi:hypothetical protein
MRVPFSTLSLRNLFRKRLETSAQTSISVKLRLFFLRITMDALNQAQTNGVVIGLKDLAGVVPRLDVDQLLLQEPDTFNLFLIALGDLQHDPNINDIMSYYQVAGRHQGEPMQMALIWKF